MDISPLINVKIERDFFDHLGLGLNLVLGIVAVFSLWISRKALKKSEFDSAMNTSPSIILRPKNIWVDVRDYEECHFYSVLREGKIIKKDRNAHEIVFRIKFECLNAGRGAAFNISKPTTNGMSISNGRNNKIPLYQTLNDKFFEIEISSSNKFDTWHNNADIKIPVNISLFYTNDQNNIFCKSTWSAEVKPFDKEDQNLKIRDTRLLNRSGKIEYSQKPFK